MKMELKEGSETSAHKIQNARASPKRKNKTSELYVMLGLSHGTAGSRA
jgi:hypothetical protein